MNPGLTYIFDVDGTLTSQRYENDFVLELAPNWPILGIALSLFSQDPGKVAVVTARPSYLQSDTLKWLQKYSLSPGILLLREEGDCRPDHEVRVDQVREIMKAAGSNVVLLDDKISNCLHVRGFLGVPYIHVKEP
jgi:hypothetical protein